MTGQRFGTSLPDQVDLIAGVSDAQLGLLADIRELIRERAALEKEYSTKLLALAKRAAEKKQKRMPSVVLGNEPSVAWTEDTLKQRLFNPRSPFKNLGSSLDRAYTQLLSSLEDSAQSHSGFSHALSMEVVEEIKTLEKRKEDAKRMQVQFFQKVIADRDRFYGERIKTQQKYYEECAEVETYRQKHERAHADRHAERAAKQYDQQKTDMLNCKNTYLVATAVANDVQAKFYKEDLPQLEDQYQDIQTNLTSRLVNLLLHTQKLSLQQVESLRAHITTSQASLNKVDIAKDQDLFITFNKRTFVDLQPWVFEACPSFYDTGAISVSPETNVFLQNKLNRAQAKLAELDSVLDGKSKEADRLKAKVDLSKEKDDDSTDRLLALLHEVMSFKVSKTSLEAEIRTISDALGDDVGAQQPHLFKSSSFSIPTTCGFCQSSIWGLSKQGKTCKLCGISVHSKCELKMPAECSRATSIKGGSAPNSPLARHSSKRSVASMPPTPSSFASIAEQSPTSVSAVIAFNFTASSAFEISVSEGDEVKVIEEDDGSGWIKILDSDGDSGLVPASYVQVKSEAPAPPTIRRGTKPKSQGSGKYVRALYSYDSQGPDELSLVEGQKVELSSGPAGGQSYGDGWWEGLDRNGKKGIFPSNYVEPL